MKPIQNLSARSFIFVMAFMLTLNIPHSAKAVTAQQVISPSGIKAWFVSDHTNPILTVKFSFQGGAALDPVGKEGLANLVSGLLNEGAGDLDSKAFQQILEDLAIRLSYNSSRD